MIHTSEPLQIWATYAIAAVFLAGTLVNLIGPAGIRRENAHWGYPESFRFVTAALEAAALVLILIPATRVVGLALGALIMLAAIGTLFRAGQFAHAIPAGVVLVVSVLLIW